MKRLAGMKLSNTLSRFLTGASLLLLAATCLPTCSTVNPQNLDDGSLDTVVLFGTGSGVGNPGGVSISFDNLRTVAMSAPVVWNDIILQTDAISFVESSVNAKDNEDECEGERLTLDFSETRSLSFVESKRTRLEGTIDDPRRFCAMIFESAKSSHTPIFLLNGRRTSDGVPIEVHLSMPSGLRIKRINEDFQFPEQVQKLWLLLIEPDELLDKIDVEEWEPNDQGLIVIDEDNQKQDARKIAGNLRKRVRLFKDRDGNGRLTEGEKAGLLGEIEIEIEIEEESDDN